MDSHLDRNVSSFPLPFFSAASLCSKEFQGKGSRGRFLQFISGPVTSVIERVAKACTSQKLDA
jgi:hypothetical protein